MREITISQDNEYIGKMIVELSFPKNAIIAMIKRKDKYITPNGSTKIELNDTLIVISDSQHCMSQVYDSLGIIQDR